MILTGCAHTAWHWIVYYQAKTPHTIEGFGEKMG
jgi:hypothetical protein